MVFAFVMRNSLLLHLLETRVTVSKFAALPPILRAPRRNAQESAWRKVAATCARIHWLGHSGQPQEPNASMPAASRAARPPAASMPTVDHPSLALLM